MEFIHISPWVNCVRQFAYLNDQGGKRQERNDDVVTFPIAFSHKILGIQLTKGWGVNAPSYKNTTLTNFTMYSHDNRNYLTTWLAYGS